MFCVGLSLETERFIVIIICHFTYINPVYVHVGGVEIKINRNYFD